jgi:hypothetical protein
MNSLLIATSLLFDITIFGDLRVGINWVVNDFSNIEIFFASFVEISPLFQGFDLLLRETSQVVSQMGLEAAYLMSLMSARPRVT